LDFNGEFYFYNLFCAVRSFSMTFRSGERWTVETLSCSPMSRSISLLQSPAALPSALSRFLPLISVGLGGRVLSGWRFLFTTLKSYCTRFSLPQHDSPSGGVGFISVAVFIPALIFVRTARFYDFILPVRFSRAGHRASSDFLVARKLSEFILSLLFQSSLLGARAKGFSFPVFVLARSGLSCLDPSRVSLLGRHSAPASHFAARFWDPRQSCFLL
jgi:hypothetical protein